MLQGLSARLKTYEDSPGEEAHQINLEGRDSYKKPNPEEADGSTFERADPEE